MVSLQIRTHVLLPKDLVDEIDRRVGPRRRSEFIARAVQQTLDVEERTALFDQFVGSMNGAETPGWETPEGAAAWVREQRTLENDPWREGSVHESQP